MRNISAGLAWRRKSNLGETALRPEPFQWTMKPLLLAHSFAQRSLRANRIPVIEHSSQYRDDIDTVLRTLLELDLDLALDPNRNKGLMNAADYAHDLSSSRSLKIKRDPLPEIKAIERKVSRKFGPDIIQNLTEAYPDLATDSILRRAINETLLSTKVDVDLAVEGRKQHGKHWDDESIQRIHCFVKGQVAKRALAMTETYE